MWLSTWPSFSSEHSARKMEFFGALGGGSLMERLILFFQGEGSFLGF